jgi:ribosomal-protein-alanine N-acetyltransferase
LLSKETPLSVIRTTRLSLREFVEEDALALLRLYREPGVERFLGPPPTSEADEQANIRHHRADYYKTRGFGLWAVTFRDNPQQLIGRCGLLVSTIAGRTETELSWTIAAAHQGRGIATEAATAVRDHATTALGQTRLVAVIAPDNAASIRVAEKLGMSRLADVSYKTFGRVHLYVWELEHARQRRS